LCSVARPPLPPHSFPTRRSSDLTRRMLKDRRSDAFLSDFFGQWLLLKRFDAVAPDPALFPEFDGDLRDAMKRETELFLESQVREDRKSTRLNSSHVSISYAVFCL